MKYNELTAEANKNRKRVGRGISSGYGKTAGRGTKGQGARTGKKLGAAFRGGDGEHIMSRLPKLRGFKNPARVEYQAVNVSTINELFPKGGEVSVADLIKAGAVRDSHPVKVLGNGEISVKVNVTAHAFSASAAEKIAAAGGSTKTL